MAGQELHEKELSPFEAAKARVGTPLNAKWTLDQLLGVGGMGAVFAATHRNGSRAAVKVLHVEFARESDIRDRFLREGKIANRVEHPARVAVTDDDVSDAGEPFLVMELLEGSTLERQIKRNGGTLGIDETLGVFDTVLDLLASCHQLSIIHRDIKPANVFITKQGEVKVLDFGVARMRDPGTEATRAGTALGTPSFMAPEQALGLDAADGRADLWSVGACILTSLTGVRLHKGQTETESFILAATQAVPSIATIAPELPVEVVAFVDKALVFDRARRFQDASMMRTELVALRQALGAGQLTKAAKKATGVVVRGNEVIVDGDSELSEEAKAQAFDRMLHFWKELGLALQGIRQYGWNHPNAVRSMQLAYESASKALVQGENLVRWEVTPTAFNYDDKLLWKADRQPFDRIPYQLFRDGIRRVQLKSGLVYSELRDFAAILLRDLSSGLGAEDDSVTALWDRRFEHIAYLAIDSFAEGDQNEQDAFNSECDMLAFRALEDSQIDKDWEEGTLEGRAMQVNLSDALREAGDAAAALALDPLTRATLGTQINLTPEKWKERYTEAFVDGYLDCVIADDGALLTDALREWTSDQVTLHNHTLVFETKELIMKAFAARLSEAEVKAVDAAIAGIMFPTETLKAIISELVKAGRDVEQAIAAPPPHAVIEGLARTLEGHADDGLINDASECYEVLRFEIVRDAALVYIRRWAEGHETDLALMLPAASAQLALEIVDTLGKLKTPAAMEALDGAFKSPHIRVRIEALAHMPDAPAERVRDELQRLLEDPAPAVRMEALRMVAKLNVVAAGPSLVRRIQSPEFHAVPVPERKEWFDAVFQLNRARAEPLAIELLKKWHIIPKEAVEQTRELAATMLATSGSPEARDALKGATKGWWWNTPPVRDAATASLKSVVERLAATAQASAAAVGESKT